MSAEAWPRSKAPLELLELAGTPVVPANSGEGALALARGRARAYWNNKDDLLGGGLNEWDDGSEARRGGVAELRRTGWKFALRAKAERLEDEKRVS